MKSSSDRAMRVFSALLLLGMTGSHAALAGEDGVVRLPGSDAISPTQCSGALASLIPECQTGKTPITIAMPAQPDAGVAPSVKLPVPARPGPEATGRPAQDTTGAATPLEAEPPTEFQRFAASSVGQILPIFGANLFRSVPTTFAPLDRVPVTADYVVGPGDEILLRVWGQINLDLDLTVDREGGVFIPQAGNVNVAGIEFRQLRAYLRSQLSRVFRNFDLSVNMGQLRSIQIFVMGQVRRPGTYTVSSLSTLVNAIFASGGPSPQGSMRRIQLKRGVELQTEFDLYDLLLKGDKSKDSRLMPGDVVYVPPAGPQVAIAGSVKTPAVYELRAESTVGDLIQMAGGLTPVADIERAMLERIKDGGSREAANLRLDQAGLATLLRNGDVLSVLTIVPRFTNVVTLRGNVANPGRFPWHPGMRLSDLIPDKESLVTREYWKKRNALGFSPLGDTSEEPEQEAEPKLAENALPPMAPDINWSYAVIERQDPDNLATQLMPFNLGKLVLEGDTAQNLELRSGDVVTVFSQADFRVARAQQTRLVRLEGEIAAPGVYAVRPGESLGELVKRAGGLTPNAYLYAAELLRESTRKDQQVRLDQFVRELDNELEQSGAARVGRATSSEESAVLAMKLQTERKLVEQMRAVKATGRIVLNLEPDDNELRKLTRMPLEDGDRFVVPAKPATVNVLGAVYNQNAFLYEPNLRLADYLKQAGGANRNADKSHIFVIRADGSVVPKTGRSLFKNGFDATKLNPGDSIVVPQAVLRTSFFQGLRDWAQMFSQMALGAAAINVLR